MKVSALYRYPVKSLGGEQISTAIAAERGFNDDRRWMLVDGTGRFISQRQHEHLARIKAEVVGATGLRIFSVADDSRSLYLTDARPSGEPTRTVTVWDDTFMACEVDAAGLEAVIGIQDARLVFMNEEVSRPVDTRYARNEETVSFADGYPYLILSTGSLRSLSDRLGRDVEMLRFRPNIVIQCDHPFAEDGWQAVRIGRQAFYLAKPCARCVMVTLEPGTGHKDLTVLSELARYRQEGHKVLFGMNALALPPHGRSISVGDEVALLPE